MNKSEISSYTADLYEALGESIITDKMDAGREYAGLRLFDAPLPGFGSAKDPLFDSFKKPEVIGPWHMSPDEWLPGAKTVISLFFPASEQVRATNSRNDRIASMPWGDVIVRAACAARFYFSDMYRFFL